MSCLLCCFDVHERMSANGDESSIKVLTAEGAGHDANNGGSGDHATSEDNNTKASSQETTPLASSTTVAAQPTATADGAPDSATVEEHQHCYYYEPAIPSMSLSVFVFWVLPVILIAIFARFAVDTTPPPIRLAPGTNIPIKFDAMPGKKPTSSSKNKKKKKKGKRTNVETLLGQPDDRPRIVRPTAPSAIPTTSTRPTWPTSYKKVGLSFCQHGKRSCPTIVLLLYGQCSCLFG